MALSPTLRRIPNYAEFIPAPQTSATRWHYLEHSDGFQTMPNSFQHARLLHPRPSHILVIKKLIITENGTLCKYHQYHCL